MIENEIIFFCYAFTVSTVALFAQRLGKLYLVGLISSMSVLANFFVTKQIELFGLTATASDALSVGIMLSLNLMQEYYSKETALKTIRVSLFCAGFYTLMSLFHLAYIPSPTDISNEMFRALLLPMPRTVIASYITFLTVLNLDTFLYGWLKEHFAGQYFVARNYATLAFTQFLDTVLFAFLGLYGLNKAFSDIWIIGEIIAVSYGIKLVVIFFSVPYIRLAKKSFFGK